MNYQEALALYEAHAPNGPLKALFRLGETAYSRRKLTEEVKKLRKGQEPQPVTTERKKVAVAQSAPQWKPTEGDPDSIRQVERDWRERYKEASHLHAQLRLMATERERKEAALSILDHFDHIHRNWEQLDAYRERGEEPVADDAEAALKSLTPAELVHRLANHRKYLSKNRNREDKQKERSKRKAECQIITRLLAS